MFHLCRNQVVPLHMQKLKTLGVRCRSFSQFIFFFQGFFSHFAIANQVTGSQISRLANVEGFSNVNIFLNVNINVSINDYSFKYNIKLLKLRFHCVTRSSMWNLN